MELQKALKEVREQKIAPVYLLIGTELYLTELFKTTFTELLITNCALLFKRPCALQFKLSSKSIIKRFFIFSKVNEIRISKYNVQYLSYTE